MAFAGLGPFFQAMHRFWNSQAATTPTVRRLTYATMALGALLPVGAQSLLGAVALGAGIFALARHHRDRNRAWVRQVVAEELQAVGTDATTDQLGVFLARLADRGLTLTDVTPATWRALADAVRLAVSDAELTGMLDAFVARYNNVLEQSLQPPARPRAIASGDVVGGLGEALALAAVAQASSYPAAATAVLSLEGLTGSMYSHEQAQRSP